MNMIDYTQSFQDFATKVKPSDLALYAGAGLVIWILFKEKLSPVQSALINLFNKAKSSLPQTTKTAQTQDTFFALVASWKQTRDLAVKNGCSEAVKVADEMFPYLSPNVCNNPVNVKEENNQ